MDSSTTRRRVLTGLSLAATGLFAPSILRAATGFPDRAITLVHGFAAGSNLDVTARVLGDAIQQAVGQPVLVDPRPGGSGVNGAARVAREKADGYTLILLTAGHTIAPALRKEMPYDSLNDFTFITLIDDKTPFCLLTYPGHPVQNMADLIEKSKASDKPLIFATSGVGQTTHLAIELLIAQTGANLRHVPYKDVPSALLDLAAERIDLTISGLSVARPQIESGTVRALGVTSQGRSAAVPDVPSFAETVAPGFNVVTYTGVAAPKGLPDDLLARLNQIIGDAAMTEAYAQKNRNSGGESTRSTPEEYRARIAAELPMWEEVVTKAGLAKV